MTLSLRLTDKDADLFRRYAELKNISVSELVRQSVMERIEDEMDLEVYNKAMEAYKAGPETYSHEEVRRMLEL